MSPSRGLPRRTAKKRSPALSSSSQPDEKHALFFALLKREGLAIPTPEFVFHPTRKWRTDYAWPDQRVALEVEGGIFTRGRHSRGAGMLKDMEKYNALAVLGWRLLRVTPSQLPTLETIALLSATLSQREAS